MGKCPRVRRRREGVRKTEVIKISRMPDTMYAVECDGKGWYGCLSSDVVMCVAALLLEGVETKHAGGMQTLETWQKEHDDIVEQIKELGVKTPLPPLTLSKEVVDAMNRLCVNCGKNYGSHRPDVKFPTLGMLCPNQGAAYMLGDPSGVFVFKPAGKE